MSTNVQIDRTPLSDDLLWGACDIAKFVGLPLRKTYYLIARGKLPARKLGPKTIVASRSELRAFLAAQGGQS